MRAGLYFLCIIVSAFFIVGIIAFNILDQKAEVVKPSRAAIKSQMTAITTGQSPTSSSSEPLVDKAVLITEGPARYYEGSSSDSSSSSSSKVSSSSSASDCLYRYGLEQSSIIFYYTDDAHSNNMKPIVDDLVQEYDFFWKADLWDKEFNDCFGFVGTVPSFLCAGSKEMLIGEVSRSRLVDFAQDCD